jgi:hypothetical protein
MEPGGSLGAYGVLFQGSKFHVFSEAYKILRTVAQAWMWKPRL